MTSPEPGSLWHHPDVEEIIVYAGVAADELGGIRRGWGDFVWHAPDGLGHVPHRGQFSFDELTAVHTWVGDLPEGHKLIVAPPVDAGLNGTSVWIEALRTYHDQDGPWGSVGDGLVDAILAANPPAPEPVPEEPAPLTDFFANLKEPEAATDAPKRKVYTLPDSDHADAQGEERWVPNRVHDWLMDSTRNILDDDGPVKYYRAVNAPPEPVPVIEPGAWVQIDGGPTRWFIRERLANQFVIARVRGSGGAYSCALFVDESVGWSVVDPPSDAGVVYEALGWTRCDAVPYFEDAELVHKNECSGGCGGAGWVPPQSQAPCGCNRPMEGCDRCPA